jgi:hypothetical protein
VLLRVGPFALTFVFVLAGCSSAALPPDVTCEGAVRRADDDAALAAALGAASPGDCVLLTGSRYAGPVTVTTGALTLVAETLASIGSTSDGVRLEASGVRLIGVTVTGAARHGIVLLGEGERLERVRVIEPGAAGVMIKCEDSGCMSRSTLSDVEVLNAAYGLYVDGARVSVIGGRVGESRSEQLGGGAGVYAVGGADLELTGTRIDANTYGLIADGAATRVRLEDAVVEANSDLGVWAQGLRGTAAQPALSVRGAMSRISDNGVTGVGAFDSAGVEIDGGEISRTIEKDVLIDLVRLVRIGDGLGALAGTRELAVSNARLIDNGRAQGLVDDAGAGIRFTATNTISGGKHRVVVQNGGMAVRVPASQTSTTPMPLPVRRARLVIPAVAP